MFESNIVLKEILFLLFNIVNLKMLDLYPKTWLWCHWLVWTKSPKINLRDYIKIFTFNIFVYFWHSYFILIIIIIAIIIIIIISIIIITIIIIIIIIVIIIITIIVIIIEEKNSTNKVQENNQ